MSNNIIFYAVFISQILLISLYYPNKIMTRLNKLQETHPPADFPKLYTQPVAFFNRMKQLFMGSNMLMLTVGFAVIVYLFQNGLVLTSNQLTGFMVLQYIPMLLLEISASKQLKLMRSANSEKIKKATLSPRRLFDFVSPKLVGVAALVYLILFFTTIYIEGIHAPWYAGYGNLVAITYANTFLMGIVFWKLYGKKQNPHANETDRINEMKAIINVMFYTSVGVGIYTITSVTLNQFENLANLQPILTSLLFQILAFFGIGYMLRSIKMTDVDFSVYQAN